MKRLLQALDIAVTTILVLVIIATSVLALASRRSPDSIPTVFGRKVLNVLSGSMAPRIRTGDMVVILPLRPGETIKDGDIITFRAADSPKMLITHRVVGVMTVEGQPATYVTKGDANNAPDIAPVSLQQIVGRYRWRVPYFGYITTFVRRPIGIVLVVILPGLLLAGAEVWRLWRLIAEAERSPNVKS